VPKLKTYVFRGKFTDYSFGTAYALARGMNATQTKGANTMTNVTTKTNEEKINEAYEALDYAAKQYFLALDRLENGIGTRENLDSLRTKMNDAEFAYNKIA
jgi:hypothetical protein